LANYNSRVTKDTVKIEWNVQRNAANIPSVGDKMFRRTSENADIH